MGLANKTRTARSRRKPVSSVLPPIARSAYAPFTKCIPNLDSFRFRLAPRAGLYYFENVRFGEASDPNNLQDPVRLYFEGREFFEACGQLKAALGHLPIYPRLRFQLDELRVLLDPLAGMD